MSYVRAPWLSMTRERHQYPVWEEYCFLPPDHCEPPRGAQSLIFSVSHLLFVLSFCIFKFVLVVKSNLYKMLVL